MLLVGHCLGIRSERRLCEEVLLNLAYRWFCRLGLDGKVLDHSTFSKNRHDRFRESDIFRHRSAPLSIPTAILSDGCEKGGPSHNHKRFCRFNLSSDRH